MYRKKSLNCYILELCSLVFMFCTEPAHYFNFSNHRIFATFHFVKLQENGPKFDSSTKLKRNRGRTIFFLRVCVYGLHKLVLP